RVLMHRVIKKVTEDIADFKFNTCVSTLMETVNGLTELPELHRDSYFQLLTIVSPFAPHIAEELWEEAGGAGFCSLAPWPTWNQSYLVAATWECPVQVNGKVRVRLTLPSTIDEAGIRSAVENDPQVQQYIAGKELIKMVIVPGRLVSIVIKP
ncbi:MAG TPA: class I tRNA ligase family protein, partial [Verrucomicrobiae bacterium]|nr:class I tRNA ligase family protein [Verrucomicrobiae bacterium]